MSRRAGAAAGTQAVDAAPPPDILARDNPRPAPSAPRPYAFPRFERRSLRNGVQLVVAPVHKLPMVSVAAVIDAGAMVDPPGKEGLALLTARALAEGARDRDGTALIDAAERLGAALDTSADWDAALVRLTVLTPGLPGPWPCWATCSWRRRFLSARSSDSRQSAWPTCCSFAPSREDWPTR